MKLKFELVVAHGVTIKLMTLWSVVHYSAETMHCRHRIFYRLIEEFTSIAKKTTKPEVPGSNPGSGRDEQLHLLTSHGC
jgi:hypothetical protein